MKPLLLAAIALMSVSALGACSHPPPTLARGAAAEVTQDGLHRLLHSGFSRAWVRSGTSFAKFERVHLFGGEIFYRRPPRPAIGRFVGFAGSNFALPEEMKSNLEESFRTIIETEITRGGQLRSVDAGGAGVLVVRALIGDVVVNVPLEALGGEDRLWIDSIGEFTLLVELYDGETRRLIGRLLERRALEAGWHRSVRATAGEAEFEANRLFRLWAKNLRSLLDEMKHVDLAL